MNNLHEQINVTIRGDAESMLRLKRLLAWLDYNSKWGHSGTVAMSLDGDGWDKIEVDGIDLSPHKEYVGKRMIHEKQMRVEYASSEEWKYEPKTKN